MSNKILSNRLSKVVTPDALVKVSQAIQLLNEVLGDETPISVEEYDSLRKIADKLKQETDDVFDIAKQAPDFLEEQHSLEEMSKDKGYYELCDNIRAKIKSAMTKLEREQNIAGAEYYNACVIYEENVGIKAKRGNAKAQNVLLQLKDINRTRGGGSTSKNGKGDKPTS